MADAGGTVLFIHGFPFDGSMWRETLAGLPPGWRGLAPDLRGFGGTEPPDAHVYRMDDYARDLVRLLDDEGVARVVVCGLSMGGYVAFALRRRFPERVAGLVLADTRAGPDTEEARRGRYELAERVLREGHQPVIDGMMPKLLPEATRASRPELVARVEDMMRRASPAAIAAALHGLADRPDSSADLSAIDIPTLVVVGAEDALTPPAESELMAEAIPGARLEVVAGAGHLTPVEKPEEFGGVVGEFLGGLGGG
jgi:3-oxoadipate enol-lactonase